MTELGIRNRDLMVIDKSLNPSEGKIVVGILEGKFIVRQIHFEEDCCWLLPANDKNKPEKITSENNFEVWGIVIHSITTL